jgi:hypothetical protein
MRWQQRENPGKCGLEVIGLHSSGGHATAPTYRLKRYLFAPKVLKRPFADHVDRLLSWLPQRYTGTAAVWRGDTNSIRCKGI